MTNHLVRQGDSGALDEGRPPVGTAIVRPLRHVIAVRERHLEQLAARSLGAESRSARAWSWILGETSIAPVTHRATVVPPSRRDVEAEIAEADARRIEGDRETRADGAANVLRWLIGDDDHLPVRGPDRGELVGGFGEVIRSPAEVADMLTILSPSSNISDDSDYRQGIAATLRWILSRRVPGPVSGRPTPELMTRHLKLERLHAEDIAARHYSGSDNRPPNHFCVGVSQTIDWLLGGTF